MAIADSDTYEWFRSNIKELKPAAAEGNREVLWSDEGQTLGVARDESGRIEIFITGAALVTESSLIAANLVHDTWSRKGNQRLIANRLVLPPAAHFDSIAAFLCAELVQNGVLDDAQRGFRRSEAVIEMAIQRLKLQGETLVGLLGELLLMTSLLDRMPPGRASDVLRSWHGHSRSTRDFQFGGLGIEVKTTRGSTSSHKVQGVRQVEVGHGVNGVFEEAFFLVSLGLERVPDDEVTSGIWTLPGLVDEIIERTRRLASQDAEALIETLLAQIHAYGDGEGGGYDHNEMKHRATFSQRWRTTFVRAYDMSDAAIKVLRSSDLVAFTMVDAASVEFVVNLPNKVEGDLNPIAGLSRSIESFVVHAWGDSAPTH